MPRSGSLARIKRSEQSDARVIQIPPIQYNKEKHLFRCIYLAIKRKNSDHTFHPISPTFNCSDKPFVRPKQTTNHQIDKPGCKPVISGNWDGDEVRNHSCAIIGHCSNMV